MKISDHERLFLTELDKHHPKAYRSSYLRAYIMMQSLFMPQVFTADAQFNNNPNLRSIIFPKEGDEIGLRDTPSDLAVLIKEGWFVPAIRDSSNTLREVRQEHIDHHVENCPSEEYVDFVDSMLDSQQLSFNGEQVANLFRNRVIDAFDESNNDGPGGLTPDKAVLIQEYANSQKKLLFAELNTWLKAAKTNRTLSHRDVAIVKNKVAASYRHNVPLAMRSNVDIRVSHSEELLPIDIRIGDRRSLKRTKSKQVQFELPPMLVLSQQFLQKAPAHALVTIKGSRDGKIPPIKSYSKVMKHLAKFRLKRKIVLDDFVQDLIRYLEETEIIFMEALMREDTILLKYEVNKSRIPPRLIPFIAENAVSFLSLIPGIGSLGTAIDLVFSNVSAYGANVELTAKNQELIDAKQLGLNMRGRERLILRLQSGRTLLPSFK